MSNLPTQTKARAIPWRNSPAPGFLDIYQLSVHLKLFLVDEPALFTFVFQDLNKHQVKACIAPELTCSCNSKTRDHCIHTVYILLKIFHIYPENPLIWQACYLEHELNEFARKRFESPPYQKYQQLQKIQKRSSSIASPSRAPVVIREKLFEYIVCAICHENIKKNQGVTYCKKGCGNNFHIQCALIWSSYKLQNNQPATCPLCRTNWGERIHEKLSEEINEHETKAVTHKGLRCASCRSYGQKCIKGKLFHCVYCEDYEICEKCFLSFQHFEHNNYLVKETTDGDWKPANNRENLYLQSNARKPIGISNVRGRADSIEKRVALLNTNLAGFDDKSHDKQISDEICIESKMNMREFFVSCLPDYKPEAAKNPYNKWKASLIGHSIKRCCSHCHSDKTIISKLKLLGCNHLLHEHCMFELMDKRNLKCPEDNLDILRGFRSAYQPIRRIYKLHHTTSSVERTGKEGSNRELIPKDLRNETMSKSPPRINTKFDDINIIGINILTKNEETELENDHNKSNESLIMDQSAFLANLDYSFQAQKPAKKNKLNTSLPPVYRNRNKHLKALKHSYFVTPNKYAIELPKDTLDEESVRMRTESSDHGGVIPKRQSPMIAKPRPRLTQRKTLNISVESKEEF